MKKIILVLLSLWIQPHARAMDVVLQGTGYLLGPCVSLALWALCNPCSATMVTGSLAATLYAIPQTRPCCRYGSRTMLKVLRAPLKSCLNSCFREAEVDLESIQIVEDRRQLDELRAYHDRWESSIVTHSEHIDGMEEQVKDIITATEESLATTQRDMENAHSKASALIYHINASLVGMNRMHQDLILPSAPHSLGSEQVANFATEFPAITSSLSYFTNLKIIKNQ